jgi:predicted transcriptional regulator
MAALKEKLSVSLSSSLVKLIESSAKATNRSKSELIEEALHRWVEHQLEEDAKKTAQITFDDLPSEDEWTQIQPKW